MPPMPFITFGTQRSVPQINTPPLFTHVNTESQLSSSRKIITKNLKEPTLNLGSYGFVFMGDASTVPKLYRRCGSHSFLGLIYSSGPQQCDCLRLLSHWGHRWDPPAMAPNLKLSTVVLYYFNQFLTLDMFGLCSCLSPSLYRSSPLPSYPILSSFSKKKINKIPIQQQKAPDLENKIRYHPPKNKQKQK